MCSEQTRNGADVARITIIWGTDVKDVNALAPVENQFEPVF